MASVRSLRGRSRHAAAAERTGRLREAFTRYAALVRELSDVEPDEPELPDEPRPLSFHVAAGIDLDAAIKQRLLVERSTARRVDALLMVLPALPRRSSGRSGYTGTPTRNGRGGTRRRACPGA